MEESKRGLNEGSAQVNNMLQRYRTLGWQVVSGDMGWNPATQKKTFRFHSASWKTQPVCRENSTGYALKTGDVSGVMGIDVDDPTLPHNRRLIELCELAGGIKQNTRKGIHYIFKNDERLRTTTNDKLKIDIRNQNALLNIEPSHYDIDGRTQFYKFQNLPNSPETIPECPDGIINYILELFRPNLSSTEKKTIRDTVKRENSGIEKLRVDISKTEEDVRTALQHINLEHAENYSDWIKVGLALHHENLGWELWDEFSRRSPKYKEGEPYYVYQSFTTRPSEEPISLRTIYWWLKNENEDVFKTLINKEENEEYQRMKEEFERTTFVCGARIIKVMENGRHTILSNADAMVMFANKMFRRWEEGKMVKQNFYYWWLRDEHRRNYERMDFIPPPMECPPTVYNLYKGFQAEKLDPINPEEEDEEELISPILKHVKVLTSDDPDYFLRWLANMIQTPSIKSQVAIVLRDESQLLKEGGGTGKNIFIEWFAKEILGEDYFAIVSNNTELFNPFNEHLEHKLLVFVEEAQAKANGKEIDHLKAMVTRKLMTVNRKGVPKYEQYDFIRYIFASNNTNPISSQSGSPSDRRFAFYDVNRSKRGDVEYFKNLNECMSNKRVCRAFFEYLKKRSTYSTPIDFQTNMPITTASLDIRRMNAGHILRWVITRIEEGKEIKGESKTLFAQFQDWMTERHEIKNEENRYSLTGFVQYLTKNCELTKPPEDSEERGHYKSNTSHIELNTERLRAELIRCQYIKPGAIEILTEEEPRRRIRRVSE